MAEELDHLLRWLFEGSAGSDTRLLVLQALRARPKNAQQLANGLELDYTPVRYHLKVLEENGIVLAEGEKYGKLYFVSEFMEANWSKLDPFFLGVVGERQAVSA